MKSFFQILSTFKKNSQNLDSEPEFYFIISYFQSWKSIIKCNTIPLFFYNLKSDTLNVWSPKK